jgi:hypothetical protein
MGKMPTGHDMLIKVQWHYSAVWLYAFQLIFGSNPKTHIFI